MTDALTYSQRLKLGAIRVRREFADQARQRAAAAALLNDHRTCEMLHAEADRHEAAIIAAAREFDEPAAANPPRAPRTRLVPIVQSRTSPAARVPWRTDRDATVTMSQPIEGWQRFVAKLG